MWFRFSIHNPTEQAVDSMISAHQGQGLSGMQLYWIDHASLAFKSAMPVAQHRSSFYIPLSLEAGETKRFLGFWPRNIEDSLIQSLQLQPAQTFQQNLSHHLSIAYLTVGIIFALTIYNLFLYFFTRENTYIYYAMDDNYRHCKDVGMDEAITKPIKLAQLKHVISKLRRAGA